MNVKAWSLAGVILTNILWGLSYVWSGVLLESMSAVSIMTIRTLIASAVLMLFVLFTRTSMKIQSRRDFWMLLLMSLFQPFLYFLCEMYSIKYTSPTFVSLMMCTIPILIPFELYVTERIRPNPRLKYGIGISVIGVAAVIAGGSEHSQLIKTSLGVVVTAVAVLCAFGFNIVTRRLTSRYSPITITSYQNMFGAAMFSVLFFLTDFRNFTETVFTPEMIRSLVILGVFCSALAFLMYINSVKHIGATVTTMINNISPIVTAIGAYFIYGERLTFIQLAGVIVTILGLMYGSSVISKRTGSQKKYRQRHCE